MRQSKMGYVNELSKSLKHLLDKCVCLSNILSIAYLKSVNISRLESRL